MLTEALDDNDAEEREAGIKAGFAWRHAAEMTVVYTDRGISRGMRMGIEHAKELNQPVKLRRLGGKWSEENAQGL